MKTILSILIILTLTICTNGQGNELYKFLDINGKYGFMDKTGLIKIKPKYLRVKDFSDGLSFVSEEVIKKGYKWICIDTLGKKVFDIDDNFPETNFSCGFARVSSFTEHWFINKKGVNEFKKSWVNGYSDFQDGIAYVGNEQYSLSRLYPINTKGERIATRTWSNIDVSYMRRHKASKNNKKDVELIAFKSDSLWGFKSKNGQILIEPYFYKVGEFENGICPVCNFYSPRYFRGFYDAIIDTNGVILNIKNMYCYLGFQGDLIEYYLGPDFSGGPHYFNKDGQIVTPKKE